MQADWSALPAVGGISIIETFDLHLHPLRLQIERLTGRRIMKYIFSGSTDANTRPTLPDVVDHAKDDPIPSRPRASMESATPSTSTRRPPTIVRSSSFQNLKAGNMGQTPHAHRAKLRKIPSSDQLVSRSEDNRRLRGITKAVDQEVEEMRARANHNRTFLHISVSR